MAIVYKTPDQVADEYLTHLKATKPSADTKQEDNDWWIRAQVTGGVVAGAYSDQRKVAEDAFVQNARREGVANHLKMFLDEDNFRPATVALGPIMVIGASGSLITAGTELSYGPNGNTYEVAADTTLTGASGEIEVQSVNVGQAQNLLEGAELEFTSPPAGVDSTAIVLEPGITDGKNEETEEEAARRVLDFIQTPPKGGHSTDYEQWAFDADPSVSYARCLRNHFGGGTVGVVITAGTTDIDTALDNGQAIVFEPSEDLVETVAAYIETKRPETDCVTVFGATEREIDVTVRVAFVSGDESTILSGFDNGNDITQGELVEREVKRAIYKTGIGGVKIDDQGYVLASDLEAMLDLKLKASNDNPGTLAELLLDRQVADLDGVAAGTNLAIDSNEVPIPGTITVTTAAV